MRLIRFSPAGKGPRLGLIEGDAITDLSARLADAPDDMVTLMERWSERRADCEALRGHADFRVADVRLHAPVARPGKIFALGGNYAEHVAEAKAQVAAHQIWFCKASTAVAGPFDDIEAPRVSTALDYEGELVVVIGKRCRHVPADEANSVIFGYAVGNDVSVRDWQLRTSQWCIGKSFDTHAPFGPGITTRDAVDTSSLELSTFVNGERRQHANTRDMIFNIPSMISELSQAMTLEPGDVIFTGTPSGVGAVASPPNYLKAGDRVRVEIEGLGAIENSVVDETRA